MKAKILVIDDEECIRFTFEKFLQYEGYEVFTAKDYNEALVKVSELHFDLIFADIVLEGNTGINFLREVKKMNCSYPVVMIAGNPSIETAAQALRLGAFDYIPKPVRQETLLQVTRNALQYKTGVDEKEKYQLNLEAIFSSVRNAIITVDKELSVIEINEATKTICNLTRDAIGKSINSLSNFCNRQCLKALEETLHEKQPAEIYRLECKHKFHPQQVVNITTHPLLGNKGVFSGAVLIIRDETHMEDLERDIRERQQFHNIIGKSEKMQAIYSLIENLADVQTTVLITGESGTGKELVAEALHYEGERNNKPFVKVNCSALSESLLESELFGHVKGAFTDAVRNRAGRFQEANSGTIFLDEIGDISPKMQLQLLRVLQERTFESVGDSTPIKIDVRVVAATNQNLKERIRHGKFREDLYYRLKVVEVSLPPLRDRREDIPLLVNHFINKFNKKLQKEIVAISSDVQKIFMAYQWPGNVRELEHTLEHAFIHCHQKTITVNYLPTVFKGFVGTKTSFIEDMKVNEPRAILQALKIASGNKAMAARLLGISRRTIYRKIHDYKIMSFRKREDV
ncbi:MAG: sigma-54-dependent Fis family transcriptional regulator [Candidatus Jettenia sp.]|nr:sigma-54-dependent Fis family transcriptional regulator [Candidatus Jettenia sp.]